MNYHSPNPGCTRWEVNAMYQVTFDLPKDVTVSIKVSAQDLPNAVLEAQKKLPPTIHVVNADSVTVARIHTF